MTVELKTTIVDGPLRAGLARLRLALPLDGTMKPAMLGIARVLKTGAQLRFRTQQDPDGQAWAPSRRASQEGGQTLSLTGRLRRSLSTRATEDTAAVGTNVVYAAIHQHGGTIRPKSGPFLSIPITPAARAAGSPRNMPGLRVAQTLKGQYILVDEQGVTHYLLRNQVVMPARPYLGASDEDRAGMLGVVQRYLEQLWMR